MKSYELHYILCGKGILVANGLKYPILPGTLYMTGPDIVHEQITDLFDPMAEYCICFEVLAHTASDDPDLSFIADQFVKRASGSLRTNRICYSCSNSSPAKPPTGISAGI